MLPVFVLLTCMQPVCKLINIYHFVVACVAHLCVTYYITQLNVTYVTYLHVTLVPVYY